jgi:uncharacterized protein YbjT (DUF2867 family)
MILLCGATGTIGSHVAARLDAAGERARALVRPTSRPRALPVGIQAVPGDLADSADFAAALDGVDRLLLICAHGPRQAQLEATAVTAAARAGVRQVVKVSGLGAAVRPNGPTLVGRAHHAVERCLSTSGMAVTLLRPTFLMSNLLATADVVAASGVLAAPMGRGRIAMVHPDDVAAVAVAALTRPFPAGVRTFDLTGPDALAYRDVARRIATHTGAPTGYLPLPDAVARRALRARGLERWHVDHLLAMASLYRAGAGASVTTAVADVTGRPPRTLDYWLAEHPHAFRAASRRRVAGRLLSAADVSRRRRSALSR